MKKTTLTIITLLSLSLYGQNLHHIPGQKSIEANIGSTKYSFFSRYELNFSKILSKKGYTELGFSFDRGIVNTITYNDYLAHLKYSQTLVKKDNDLFINLKGGLELGYQQLSSTIIPIERAVEEGFVKKDKFIYGLSITPEIEYFFSKSTGITLFFNQTILFNTNFTDKNYYYQYNYGIGIKQLFN